MRYKSRICGQKFDNLIEHLTLGKEKNAISSQDIPEGEHKKLYIKLEWGLPYFSYHGYLDDRCFCGGKVRYDITREGWLIECENCKHLYNED